MMPKTSEAKQQQLREAGSGGWWTCSPRHRVPRILGGSAIALLALACLFGVGATGCWGADGGATDEAISRAAALAKGGEGEKAEALLLSTIKSHPQNVEALIALAELYEGEERDEEALELYGHVLSNLQRDDDRARAGVRRVFFRGRFPRQIQLRYLKLAPVDFAARTCRLAEDVTLDGNSVRVFAYTRSLIYPPALSRGKTAPWVALPPSLGSTRNMMYNRVGYGMISDAKTSMLHTRWMVGYPSPGVLLSGGDYSQLAGQWLDLLLRGHIYIQEYLGIDSRPDEQDVFQTFLTEHGPAGAEQVDDRIFLYDVENPRTSLELMREAFHELGHTFLPRIGPFDGSERWASGALAERLLFQWLLEEAESVTGSPWSSRTASDLLTSAHGLERPDMRSYMADRCQLPLSAWLSTAPEQFTDKDAIERFVGFCLWIQAAHGRSILAAVLQKAQQIQPQEFAQAYKQTIRQAVQASGRVYIDAGALHPVESKLAQAPQLGPVRHKLIAMNRDGSAVYRVYLPAGTWKLRIEHAPDTDTVFEVAIDGACIHQGKLAGGVEVGAMDGDWHRVKVTCRSTGPIELSALEFIPVSEASQ